MNKSNKPISMPEYLSAVLDDESGSFEQKRVLDELSSNQILRDKMSHFALIGEAMRSAETDNQTIPMGNSFLAGIQDQIKTEETYHDVVADIPGNVQTKTKNSWLRPAGGFAMAASLAALAVIGVQNFQSQGLSNQQTITSAEIPQDQLSAGQMANAIPVSTNKISDTKQIASLQSEKNNSGPKEVYKQANAKTRSLLKRYVDSHMQYASTAAFVPSVRVIAYTDYQ